MSLAMNAIIVIAADYLGMYFSYFKQKGLLFYKDNANPFIIVGAVSLFCAFYKKYNKDAKLNDESLPERDGLGSNLVIKTSRMTMLVYLIHDNIIFRSLIRPYIVDFIYYRFT